MREMHPVGGHGVLADHGAKGDGGFVAALIAFHADGLHRQQDGAGLPGLLIPAGFPQFLDEDGIRLSGDGEPLLA